MSMCKYTITQPCRGIKKYTKIIWKYNNVVSTYKYKRMYKITYSTYRHLRSLSW